MYTPIPPSAKILAYGHLFVTGGLEWLKQHENGKQLADAVRAQFYAALRSCEVELIRGGDLCGTNPAHLLLRFEKTRKLTCEKPRYKPLSYKGETEVRSVLQDIPHGEPAFPAYKKRRVSELIRKKSKELKWPTTVKFDGTHTLRHGGTGVIVNDAIRLLAHALAGMPEKVRNDHYLAPRYQYNEKRTNTDPEKAAKKIRK